MCIAASFLLVCLLPSLLTLPSSNPPWRDINNNGRFNNGRLYAKPYAPFVYEISHQIFLFIAVVLFSLLLRVRTSLFEAEAARQQAELSYVKAQINPHFLFNTLNSIYSFALTKDERTPDAIVQLSELMRYIIRDAGNNLVSLEKEINYINNYIALQKARLGDTVTIDYEVTGETTGKQITPLILTTFVENAFKHGVNPDEDSNIRINISVQDNNVHLLVSNKKVNSNQNEKGIGVNNTKKRLELLYPLKHTLTITDANNTYTVALLITLA
jgi:LytS/YehU family sensor histidine kinase